MNKKTTGSENKTTKNKKGSKKKEDRSWIAPPNSISKKTDQDKKSKNYPKKISYWIDKNGEAQLYTKEQLAKCNILMNINVLINKSLILMENIQNMDENTTIGTLKQQDYAQFETSQSSAYAQFIHLMAAALDITFGEFLNFISQGDDSKVFLKIGKVKLDKIIKGNSSNFVNFFTSDKLKE